MVHVDIIKMFIFCTLQWTLCISNVMVVLHFFLFHMKACLSSGYNNVVCTWLYLTCVLELPLPPYKATWMDFEDPSLERQQRPWHKAAGCLQFTFFWLFNNDAIPWSKCTHPVWVACTFMETLGKGISYWKLKLMSLPKPLQFKGRY